MKKKKMQTIQKKKQKVQKIFFKKKKKRKSKAKKIHSWVAVDHACPGLGSQQTHALAVGEGFFFN
jgi:coenzyme F420-reducing hydrogenase gamma subunit